MKNVSDRMILMAEAKPMQSSMRSEGFFFRGRGKGPWPVYYFSGRSTEKKFLICTKTLDIFALKRIE